VILTFNGADLSVLSPPPRLWGLLWSRTTLPRFLFFTTIDLGRAIQRDANAAPAVISTAAIQIVLLAAPIPRAVISSVDSNGVA
jgi:hypothetical protein